MKLGEVVVSMGTTTSPSFIKIGLKTKKFSHEPISGTFECGVNNRTVEVHHHCYVLMTCKIDLCIFLFTQKE